MFLRHVLLAMLTASVGWVGATEVPTPTPTIQSCADAMTAYVFLNKDMIPGELKESSYRKFLELITADDIAMVDSNVAWCLHNMDEDEVEAVIKLIELVKVPSRDS